MTEAGSLNRGTAIQLSTQRVHFLDLEYGKYEIGAQALLSKVKKFMAKTKERDQLREAQDMLDGLPELIDRLRTMSKTGRDLVLLKVEKPEAAKDTKADAPSKSSRSG